MKKIAILSIALFLLTACGGSPWKLTEGEPPATDEQPLVYEAEVELEGYMIEEPEPLFRVLDKEHKTFPKDAGIDSYDFKLRGISVMVMRPLRETYNSPANTATIKVDKLTVKPGIPAQLQFVEVTSIGE